VFQTFLIGQALSFALLKRGLEPLHATAVIVGGRAIAFLGDSGQGKSTLGASFLQAGCSLLCDDLLILKNGPEGGMLAYPGMPRIKLFPEIATQILGATASVNPATPKRVIRIDRTQFQQSPVRLEAMYVLRPPRHCQRHPRIRIRPLSPHRACLELVKNTYNPVVWKPQRLAQQFAWATQVASCVPMHVLTYPKCLDDLPRVRQAILSDLAGSG